MDTHWKMFLFSPLELLWLVPLVGGLLLLYFLRPRRQSKVVPSLYLWLAVPPNSRADQPFQALKFTLLLLLQLLVLLIIIFALAQPFGRPRPVKESYYALIIDASASMKATDVAPSRFEQAKLSAEHFIQTNLLPNDKVVVVLAGRYPVIVCSETSDVGKMIAAISNLSASDSMANIKDAVLLARNAMKHHLTNVLLFSDEVWTQSDGSATLDQAADAPVDSIEVGSQSPSNVGIVGISERLDPVHTEHPPQLLVSVDRKNASSATLVVQVEKHTVFRDKIPAGEGIITKVYSVGSVVSGELITANLVGMTRDELAADNTSQLIVNRTDARRVLLVTQGDPYLERALSVLPNVSLYEVQPAQYSAETDQFDVVIFDQWLPSTLPQCPVMVFDAIDAEMPVVSQNSRLQNPQIVDWDDSDSLLNYVDLSTTHVSSAIDARLAPLGVDVADFQLGPAIAKGTRNGNKVLWVAFAPTDSDLPLSLAFPIFLSNSINALAPDSTDERVVGRAIELPPISGSWTVVGPDGHQDQIACDPQSGCVDNDTDEAGTYRASFGSQTNTYVLNLASSTETELTPSSHPDVHLDDGTHFQHSMRQNNLTSWFAAAALMIVFIEWLVYHRPNRYTNRI